MTSNAFRCPSLSSIFKPYIFKAIVFLGCMLALTINARAGFLYAVNQQNGSANQIYGFNVNETTGALVLLAGFPVSSGGIGGTNQHADQMEIDLANRRLYVLNRGSNTVTAFSINPTTGALTALPFSPISLPSELWLTMAVHPSGSPLILGSGATSVVASFKITATSATAAPGSPYSAGTAIPVASVFSRDGNFLYTGCNSSMDTFYAGFSVNAITGALTALPGSPFDSGATATSFAMDSQGRLFMANIGSNQVRAFTTASGVPTAVTGNPFTSGLNFAVDGVLHPNEQFYYVADVNGNSVGAYQITGSGAATTLTALAGSPFATSGSMSRRLVFNNRGAFLFAANSASRNVTTYSVNAGTGIPTFGNVQAVNTLGSTGILTGMAYLPTSFIVTNINNTGAGSLRQAVTDANAGNGGGLISFDPTLFATPQTISLSGGQITINSNITIVGPGANLLTVRNTAVSGRVFIISGDTVNLSGMTITGGRASGGLGGGIFMSFDILTLTNCVVSDNLATESGGIHSDNGTLNVINSTISGNTSNESGNGGGGGITTFSSTLNVTGSTISGNSALNGFSNGGGIYMSSSIGTITNSTITNNLASGTNSAGGVKGSVTVRNSIIAGNQNNATVPDVTSASSSGFNLIGNVGTNTGFNQTGDQTGTGASVLNPFLAPLSNNGGTTPTHALLSNSPAIDKGSSSNIASDQRGFTRSYNNLRLANTADGTDIGAFESRPIDFDFDGDGRTDISVFRPSNGGWFMLFSSDNTFHAVAFGTVGDVPVAGDYDGDGKADIAVFRPSNGFWFYLRSSDGAFQFQSFGASGDIPVPGDYDGNGITNFAVWRPSTGYWYTSLDPVTNFGAVLWGNTTDKVVPADYDGDGRTDIAVFRPSTRVWYLLRSALGFQEQEFGIANDTPVPADYNGDGRADFGLFRQSTGFWYTSMDPVTNYGGIQHGQNGDIPAPGHFDGDAKADVTVFRTGDWFVFQSSTRTVAGTHFGASGDQAVPSAIHHP